MKMLTAGVLILGSALSAASLSPLYERGYTVMPEPQKVTLGADDFRFGPQWRIETGAGVQSNDVAVEALRDDLESRFHVKLGGTGGGVVRLRIATHSVAIGAAQDRNKDALAEQAYKLDLAQDSITITGNAAAGLFYGVETLVQLLKPRDGALWLPEGHIEDWPDLELRQIYWDDAHHLDKPEVLKKAMRQAAFFKINGFVLKLEGHFQFKSAPAVVEPYALTPAEYQDLTNYGLRYHVQLIPYLDGPGHIAFILKHPEYAKLREYPDSNYELCVTNPDSYTLLEGMFHDLMDANKGVKYIYLSTDEPYYIGMANNAGCQEGARAKELGSVGKMLAEFTTKMAGDLHSRGRTVMFWGEFPMKPEDLAALPRHIVNGEVYGPQFDPAFKKQGIREIIYTSTEGEEKMFPGYFPLSASRKLHSGRGSQRVADTFRKISFDTARRDADLMGEINAGWADMGLHPETFWLGLATSASTGWHPGSPDPGESMSTFYPLFYGWSTTNISRVYQLMSTQAQFWVDSWETTTEIHARKGIWGYSAGIYDTRRPARDQTIPLPPAPDAGLSYHSDWAEKNARRMQLVNDAMGDNRELFGLLYENYPRVDLNRYNLAVFLSIAGLYRQNLEMLESIAGIDRMLKGAAAAAGRNNPKQALQSMDRALAAAQSMQWSRNRALHDTEEVWYKSWYPRVTAANGRQFLHELDDVKDHLPDRTTDMSYLVYREMLLPVNEWVEQIRTARNQYAQAHQMPALSESFDWKDQKPVSGAVVGAISLE